MRYHAETGKIVLTDVVDTEIEVEHEIRTRITDLGWPERGFVGEPAYQHRFDFGISELDMQSFKFECEADRAIMNLEIDRMISMGGQICASESALILCRISVDEFPVRMYGYSDNWSSVFDDCDHGPYAEQGHLVDALIRARLLPPSLRRGSVFYIREHSVHPAVFGQGLERDALGHIDRWLSVSENGLVVADPPFNYEPVMGMGDEAKSARNHFREALYDLGYKPPPPAVFDKSEFAGTDPLYKVIRPLRIC